MSNIKDKKNIEQDYNNKVIKIFGIALLISGIITVLIILIGLMLNTKTICGTDDVINTCVSLADGDTYDKVKAIIKSDQAIGLVRIPLYITTIIVLVFIVNYINKNIYSKSRFKKLLLIYCSPIILILITCILDSFDLDDFNAFMINFMKMWSKLEQLFIIDVVFIVGLINRHIVFKKNRK